MNFIRRPIKLMMASALLIAGLLAVMIAGCKSPSCNCPSGTTGCTNCKCGGDAAACKCKSCHCAPSGSRTNACNCPSADGTTGCTNCKCGGDMAACKCKSCNCAPGGSRTNALLIPPTPPATVPAHSVNAEKELIIRDLRVVESARALQVGGPWHIGTLFSNMTPTGGNPSTFVLRWLRTWETPQTVENGLSIPARASIKGKVIDPWLGAQASLTDEQVKLDWSKAPFRLLAIVCRTDLSRMAPNLVQNAGEGRFVFCVTDPAGAPLPFTVIFEYSLQADTMGKVRDWAKLWHNLGTLGDFDEPYLAELERITAAYSGKGIAPTKPNGNALNQLRANEIALASPWELREWQLSPADGFLKPVTVKVTPDLPFNNSQRLANFITSKRTDIDNKNHDIPLDFETQPFRAASSLNPLPKTVWQAPGFPGGKTRHLFALSTCSGCHGEETALPTTKFTHIDQRAAGQVAGISAFLTDAGATIPDPDNPAQTIQLSDLKERKKVLTDFANISPQAASALPETIRIIQSRRNRVH